ncbi:MAG TPA: hypothetical protein DEA22_03830, partial [Blastocatellia bacterium]|nr:hypothetical protein [Blastocatellia bacterium]
DQENIVFRVDFLLNERNTITGTFRDVSQNTFRPDIDNTFSSIPTAVQPSTQTFISLGWTWAA